MIAAIPAARAAYSIVAMCPSLNLLATKSTNVLLLIGAPYSEASRVKPAIKNPLPDGVGTGRGPGKGSSIRGYRKSIRQIILALDGRIALEGYHGLAVEHYIREVILQKAHKFGP